MKSANIDSFQSESRDLTWIAEPPEIDMSCPKATKLEYARHRLKRMVDDESAFRSRVAGLSAEQQAKAVEWFYRMRDKQLAFVQQLESESERAV
jgi:hypothetical protein